jgi:carbon storage regulator
MLFLTRKVDEKIMIGEDIELTLVDVRDNKVRIGIDAPRGIPVHRQEIYDDIQREIERGERGQGDLEKHVNSYGRPHIDDEIRTEEQFLEYLDDNNYGSAYTVLRSGTFTPTLHQLNELQVGLDLHRLYSGQVREDLEQLMRKYMENQE